MIWPSKIRWSKKTIFIIIIIVVFFVPGIKMQCSNSNLNSSGGGLIDRKPSYFGHPAGSVTLSSLSSLSSLNLSNIGGLGSGLSISNIPGAAVSSNIHHATTTPPTTMYYDPIKYSMSNVWRRSGRQRENVKIVQDWHRTFQLFVKFVFLSVRMLWKSYEGNKDFVYVVRFEESFRQSV